MNRRVVGRAGLSGLQTVAPALSGRRVNRDLPLAVDRLLALPGEVLVSAGEDVEPDTPVARALDVPAKLYLTDLAPVLSPPYSTDDVRRVLCVMPGDVVVRGQAVARTRTGGWMDQGVREVPAPADGVVEFVSLGRAQVVIRAPGDESGHRLSLPVAAELGIEPRELPRHARCRPGQSIEVGDVLARGPGLALAREFRSPVSGVVESVSPLTGLVTVLQEPRKVVLRAYLRGRVDSVTPGYGVRISARGHRILGILGLGAKSWGRLQVAGLGRGADGRPEPLRAADVTADLNGSVLLFPGEVTAEALHECRRCGVRGVIAASARAGQLAEFAGGPLAAEIVTGPGALSLRDEGRRRAEGAAEPGLTLVLTEGLGRLLIDREIYSLLSAHAGQMVSLDGLTQIRAGVVRPVVLLPLGPPDPDRTGGTAHAPAEAAPAEAAPALPPDELQAGTRVRLVRGPHFGSWGTVVVPPAGLTRLQTEVEARVLRVRLDDGRTVAVAEANVEL